jgi:hypothetical protein
MASGQAKEGKVGKGSEKYPAWSLEGSEKQVESRQRGV